MSPNVSKIPHLDKFAEDGNSTNVMLASGLEVGMQTLLAISHLKIVKRPEWLHIYRF